MLLRESQVEVAAAKPHDFPRIYSPSFPTAYFHLFFPRSRLIYLFLSLQTTKYLPVSMLRVFAAIFLEIDQTCFLTAGFAGLNTSAAYTPLKSILSICRDC